MASTHQRFGAKAIREKKNACVFQRKLISRSNLHIFSVIKQRCKHGKTNWHVIKKRTTLEKSKRSADRTKTGLTVGTSFTFGALIT